MEIEHFAHNQSLKTITFSWNAPQIDSKAFDGGISSSNREVIATCYYPSNNPVWTSSMLQNYGGKLTWVAKEMVKPSGGTESDTGNNEQQEAIIMEATITEAIIMEATITEAIIMEATIMEAIIMEVAITEAIIMETTIVEAILAKVEIQEELELKKNLDFLLIH